ncbi:hypothetical protein UG54_00175 [Gordonia sihwensis]|nr:hypothetical protein UG54_00175 [Gordonia sihwensis]
MGGRRRLRNPPPRAPRPRRNRRRHRRPPPRLLRGRMPAGRHRARPGRPQRLHQHRTHGDGQPR